MPFWVAYTTIVGLLKSPVVSGDSAHMGVNRVHQGPQHQHQQMLSAQGSMYLALRMPGIVLVAGGH